MEYILISTKENKTIGKATLSKSFDALHINFESGYKNYIKVIARSIDNVKQEGGFDITTCLNEESLSVDKMSRDVWEAIKQNLLMNTQVILHINRDKSS
ncbi:hypothetical protein A2382_01995 [Candidatus Woesebacteria bacterium RIFOXYB1_FULL_38_16]|uniref:Uncharacterized protein n=1 Tax=Candidatus Woesebacteria bacterium RIFOXYB1_FULL_38_16 TaxID=1802538 RepID=A0A1F8CTN6_9BACT|nr:MAG: hypothetical protein A2191_04895 [Candidatus Woesebacteria bacterium RIFOXYA1_FULL_38_9]OGM79670.1 MAG: hypothetical protein A2382_01995 [Candidatus Woesebacteria bacterium RIFOXYB1_FULL_38_16]